MQFVAKAFHVRMSPYKLRSLADVVRGKNVSYALHWLATHPVRRATPVRKVIESAAGNAKDPRRPCSPKAFRLRSGGEFPIPARTAVSLGCNSHFSLAALSSLLYFFNQ